MCIKPNTCNSGDFNTGHNNTGHNNTGRYNTGDNNSGHGNSGDWNSGHNNTGHNNTGRWNSGHGNTGNWNSGDSNSGDWNSGSENTGYLNTDRPKLRIFNKETDIPEKDIIFPWFFFDVEIKSNKTYEEAWKEAWEYKSDKDIDTLFRLPNFDPYIFEEITGIGTKELYLKWKENN